MVENGDTSEGGNVLKKWKKLRILYLLQVKFFNQSGEIIGCPILGESTESHFTFMLKWMKIKVISNVNK